MSRTKGLVPTKRSYHKKYSHKKLKLALTFEKVFKNVGQTQRSRSQSQKCCRQQKVLVTRNTLVKYQSSSTHCLKVISNVKVFKK